MHVVGFPGEPERSYDLYKSTYEIEVYSRETLMEKLDDKISLNQELIRIIMDYLKDDVTTIDSVRTFTNQIFEEIPKEEELTDEILKLKMFGNQGVLTYINQTSGGQSGGAVIQQLTKRNYDFYGDDEIQHLIGIHVSGHLHQSKCTLLCESNLNWMQSIIIGDNKNNNLSNVFSMEQRIIKFMDDFANSSEKIFTISDLEIFTVTSKIMGIMTNHIIEEIKFDDVCKNSFFEEDDKLHIRLSCLDNIFTDEQENITKLNLNKSKMKENVLNLFTSKLSNWSNLISLNLQECNLYNIDSLCEILPNINLGELYLGTNEFENDVFAKLLHILPQTNMKKLNVEWCRIVSFENIKLLKKNKLEELYLGGNKFGNEEFSKLFNILPQTNIIKLNVRWCGITSLENIKLLQNTKLEELNLVYNDFGNNGFAKLLHILPKTIMKKLNVSKCSINSLENIELLSNTKIEELNLGYNYFGNDAFAKLLHILPQTNMKKLNVRDFGITSFENIAILINTKIEELDLGHNKFGNDSFEKLLHILPQTNIKKLYVRYCALTSLVNIEILKNTKIEELDLTLNTFGNDGFEKLLYVLPQTKMKTLNVEKCGITSLKNIELLQNTNLEELTLDENEFGNDGFEKLLHILPKTNIKKLYVTDCGITSLENIKILRNRIVGNYCLVYDLNL